jgi:metal-responsive CopG/Arc/MetJ family transcriptional regulator
MPRLDIRLDHDCRARLDAVVQESGLSASEIIRNLINQAFEDVIKKERQNAFQRLISLNIETPPDPAELSRELEEAHAPGHIY